MNEASLVRQAQAGQEKAFAELYEAYADKIHAFILHKTFHVPTAEDLTSETFFKALNHLDKFDSGKGNFSTWLFSIARNNVVDHYRKDRPSLDIEDAWDLSSPGNVTDEVALALSSGRLKTCMKSLTAHEREIITMRFWQEMTYAEIASSIGKKEAAVKMQVLRLLKKLKKVMPEFWTFYICLTLLS